ncbi:hypothetical protein MAR_028898, partial [Mya arenaria]
MAGNRRYFRGVVWRDGGGPPGNVRGPLNRKCHAAPFTRAQQQHRHNLQLVFTVTTGASVRTELMQYNVGQGEPAAS